MEIDITEKRIEGPQGGESNTLRYISGDISGHPDLMGLDIAIRIGKEPGTNTGFSNGRIPTSSIKNLKEKKKQNCAISPQIETVYLLLNHDKEASSIRPDVVQKLKAAGFTVEKEEKRGEQVIVIKGDSDINRICEIVGIKSSIAKMLSDAAKAIFDRYKPQASVEL